MADGYYKRPSGKGILGRAKWTAPGEGKYDPGINWTTWTVSDITIKTNAQCCHFKNH